MKTALLILLLPLGACGMDIYSALSMLETGNNDKAVGRAGEISRYQILKSEWRSVTPSRNYRDPQLARQVATQLLNQRVDQFSRKFNRAPSCFEIYVLWNAPAQALSGRVTHTVAERARRFSNLCYRDHRGFASLNPSTARRPS